MTDASSLHDHDARPPHPEIANAADRVRRAVLAAVEAGDASTKALWWHQYRLARAEALAIGKRRRLLRLVRG